MNLNTLAKWKREVDDGRGVMLHIHTVAGLNQREHWVVRANRVKRERMYGCIAARKLCKSRHPPSVVTFTRYSAALMDTDNLPQCAKGLRDSIAKYCGVDDGPSGPISWVYKQEKCPRGCYGMRIEVE